MLAGEGHGVARGLGCWAVVASGPEHPFEAAECGLRLHGFPFRAASMAARAVSWEVP